MCCSSSPVAEAGGAAEGTVQTPASSPPLCSLSPLESLLSPAALTPFLTWVRLFTPFGRLFPTRDCRFCHSIIPVELRALVRNLTEHLLAKGKQTHHLLPSLCLWRRNVCPWCFSPSSEGRFSAVCYFRTDVAFMDTGKGEQKQPLVQFQIPICRRTVFLAGREGAVAGGEMRKQGKGCNHEAD